MCVIEKESKERERVREWVRVYVCQSDHLSPCALLLQLSGPPARLPSHPFSTDLFYRIDVCVSVGISKCGNSCEERLFK